MRRCNFPTSADSMARQTTMRTPHGRWTVEVITTRGGQVFRLKDLHVIPKGTMNPPGRLLLTIAELREVMGDAYDTLVEDRSGRFDGGR